MAMAINREFKVTELLQALDEEEIKVFRFLLRKLGKNTDPDLLTGLTMLIADRLHSSHDAELSTALSMLVNKLVQPPFDGDRELTKGILERILFGIKAVEDARK